MKTFQKLIFMAIALLSIQSISFAAAGKKATYATFATLVDTYKSNPTEQLGATLAGYYGRLDKGDQTKANTLLQQKQINLDELGGEEAAASGSRPPADVGDVTVTTTDVTAAPGTSPTVGPRKTKVVKPSMTAAATASMAANKSAADLAPETMTDKDIRYLKKVIWLNLG